MSIEAMNYVWEYSPYTGAKGMMHLAVADVVNDMYENRFFMTNEELAGKAKCKRETANRFMKELVEDGWLQVVGSKGQIVEYRFLFKTVTPSWIPKRKRVSDESSHTCDKSSHVPVINGHTPVTNDHTEPKTKTNSGTQLELQTPEISNSDDVKKVWEAWVASRVKHNGRSKSPKFTEKRRKLIKSRLKDYSVEDLVLAVTGWILSDFHCGNNDQGKVYNSIELLLRDDEKIEQFIGYHSKPPSKQTITEKWSDPNRKTKSGTIVLNNMEQ